MIKGKNWADFQGEKETRRQKEVGKGFLVFCIIVLAVFSASLNYWQGKEIKNLRGEDNTEITEGTYRFTKENGEVFTIYLDNKTADGFLGGDNWYKLGFKKWERIEK